MRTLIGSLALAALALAHTPAGRGGEGMSHGGHAMAAAGATPWSLADDAAFLGGMIAHHEGAVAMAEEVLKKGKNPRTRTWAEGIITAQRKEIAEMSAFFAKFKTPDAKTKKAFDDAHAAMKKDMDAMMAAPMDPDPDRDFVLMMIPHHAGAVAMSLPVLTSTDNPELRTLAREIIVAQAKEIAEFRDWLAAAPAASANPHAGH